MKIVTIKEEKLKDLLKSALVEALEEHRDLIQEIMEEAMEDIGLTHAIKQDIESESISHKEVFAILEDDGYLQERDKAMKKNPKYKHHCLRCGNVWESGIKNPIRDSGKGGCNSTVWDIPGPPLKSGQRVHQRGKSKP